MSRWNSSTEAPRTGVAGPALLALLILSVAPLTLDARGSGARSSTVYPNPFRSNETVNFTLTIPPPGEQISINVYDVLGRHVRQLWPEDPSVRVMFYAPGIHPIPWDGNDRFGIPVSVGPYFCVLAAGDNVVRTVKVIKNRQ